MTYHQQRQLHPLPQRPAQPTGQPPSQPYGFTGLATVDPEDFRRAIDSTSRRPPERPPQRAPQAVHYGSQHTGSQNPSQEDADELVSQQLILKLLEDDLRNAEGLRRLREEAIDGIVGTGSYDPSLTMNPDEDHEMAEIQDLVSNQQIQASSALANKLARPPSPRTLSNEAASLAFIRHAQAEETKATADREFARRLQQLDEQGEWDIDDRRFEDIEHVLGSQRIKDLMASSTPSSGSSVHQKRKSNLDAHTELRPAKHSTLRATTSSFEPAKGKGKAREEGYAAPMEAEQPQSHFPDENNRDSHARLKQYRVNNNGKCGICFDEFRVEENPQKASRNAGGSSVNQASVGLRLLKCRHQYCMDCLAAYIMHRIKDHTRKAFPVPCPECQQDKSGNLDENSAAKVLNGEQMTDWHTRQLQDGLPQLYCPNKRCSARIIIDDDDSQPQATCPACSLLICWRCRCLWGPHQNYTCDEFQALPLNQRSPEDFLALEVARHNSWKRCPGCSALVELSHGCSHMTCTCGAEWCYQCGSKWGEDGCTNDPPCPLWEERNLFAQQERERIAAHNRGGGITQELAWLGNYGGGYNGLHRFTATFLQDVSCGYCQRQFNSYMDLTRHMSNCRHPIYSCCARFFRAERDLNGHMDSSKRGHFNTFVKLPEEDF